MCIIVILDVLQLGSVHCYALLAYEVDLQLVMHNVCHCISVEHVQIHACKRKEFTGLVKGSRVVHSPSPNGASTNVATNSFPRATHDLSSTLYYATENEWYSLHGYAPINCVSHAWQGFIQDFLKGEGTRG